MKKTVSLLLVITLFFSIGIIATSAEEAKILPELQSVLDEMSDDETAEVAVWTTYTMSFKSGADMVEYVNKKTREKLGLRFQINTVEDLDTWRKTYNSIMFEIESGNRKVVIEKLGLTEEIIDQACNMIIANLTKEQINAAAALSEVNYIEPNPFNAPFEDPVDDFENTAPDNDDGLIYEPLDPAHLPEPELWIIGDVDEDGEVTVLDATRIQRALAELVPIDSLNAEKADVDGDGEMTVLDATRIQRTLAFGDDEFYYDPEDGKYHYPGDKEGEIYYHDGSYYHYGYEIDPNP